MMKIFYCEILLISVLHACAPGTKDGGKASELLIRPGPWRGSLQTQGIEIPFQFVVEGTGTMPRIDLMNAEERIGLEEVRIVGDSIHIPLYIFDAAIHAKIRDKQKLEGVWVKNYAEDYVIDFVAEAGEIPRFSTSKDSVIATFSGKWEVDFISREDATKAIGLFEQQGKSVTGTFLTSTGDYRYLEGIVDGNEMKISCFDGTHAYLFEATMQADGTLRGEFWSGKSWHQEWVARRNEFFELPDPYSITAMKPGYERFEIKFPNTSGDLVELSDKRYRNKVVVVQIMGSWCANCMDETRFYTDWLERNKDRKVEILGLAFERKADVDYAIGRIEHMRKKLGVNYEVLIAGTTDSASRAQALPMLTEVISFPTSIVLDKEHKVRKIHTGFSGPGTGIYFERFVEDFNLMMDKLLTE